MLCSLPFNRLLTIIFLLLIPPAAWADKNTIVPKTAIIPISEKPDLTGCGFLPEGELLSLRGAMPPISGEWYNGKVETPCKGLKSGFTPNLEKFCNKHQLVSWRLPDGRPGCRWEHSIPKGTEANSYALIFTQFCTEMFPRQNQLRKITTTSDGKPKLTGFLYPVIKYTTGKLECFYISLEAGSELMLWRGDR